ncbi:MFS transporter [Specibacter cremeus]|uniref:MFS transporter n=1 Tax=Specibacter cremeus TaxID=1629051 RepID=UPI000F7B26EE|nr:MFS transporter [Specibacter cremeus]
MRAIAVPVFGPTLLFGVAQGAILPVIPLTARDMGASLAAAALVVTLMGLGSLVSNIPASLLTARFGERMGLVGASVLTLVALLLCILAHDLWLFALGVLLIGAASAEFNLARQSYLTAAVPPTLRARAMSTLGGVGRIGIFAGPFVGALAIHLAGLAGAYWVAAVAVAAAGVVVWTLPDLESRPGRAGAAAGPAPTVRHLLGSYGRLFATLGVGVVLVSAVRSARQVVIPLWADNLGLDATTTSLIYGLSGAVDMLVFYPAGKVMDQKGRSAVAVPSMALMGLGLLAMPFTHGAGSLLLVALLVGLGNGIGSGLIMTLGADHSPALGRPQFLGIWRFLSDVGNSGGPALLSAITAVATLSVGIGATGALGLVAAAVLWYWIPRSAPAART